jgi:hypothetical protein
MIFCSGSDYRKLIFGCIGLAHIIATVLSHTTEDCDTRGLDQANCPVAASVAASELLQMEVQAKEMRKEIVTVDYRVQHVAMKLSGNGQVTMKPYECQQSEALQSTTDDAGITKIQKLNVHTGEYIDILVVPTDWTEPEFRSINSCAISPVDGIIHCSMEINGKGSFLVRIDMTQVAFVAKLPGWRYAATFDKFGNYWMYGNTGLSVIKDVASKPSYSSWSYLSGNAPGAVSMTLGADLVVLYGGVYNSNLGQKELEYPAGAYLLSLYKSTLFVVNVTTDDYTRWTLPFTTGLPKTAVTWGSAWNFNNSIFFSSDTGEGVYRLDDSSLDIKNGSASFMFMGPAQTTDWNDGFSCVGKGTPWEPNMIPYDCKGERALQATTTNMTVPTTPASKTYFEYLDISTGKYQLYYEVQKNWTDPPFNSINSCAINPIDNVIHCTMEIDDRGSFLVRIDETKVGFVTKVPGWMYAGVFDSDGTYYMYGNVGLSWIANVSKIQAYTSYDHLGSQQLYNGPHKLKNMGADMAVLRADWEGTGMKPYLLSVEGDALYVIQPSEDNPPAQWKLVGSGLPEMTQTWGSAWNFQSKVYFAPDTGEGVYELMTENIELENGTAQFEKAGKSQSTGWNDGFSCICEISPFTTAD